MDKNTYNSIVLNNINQINNTLIQNKVYDMVKRVSDIVISLILLLILFPVFLILSLIIYFQTGLNPIYIQQRGLTLSKYQFKIFKLRTLHPSKVHHTDSNIFLQSEFKNSVIPIGRFLRKTGLDEIPQLINVLLGNMSMIGPRPLSNTDLQIIKENNYSLYLRRENVDIKPGISGYWQIFGNREKGFENMVELEEYYKFNRSIVFDIFLMVMTFPLMIFAKHSDAIIN